MHCQFVTILDQQGFGIVLVFVKCSALLFWVRIIVGFIEDSILDLEVNNGEMRIQKECTE